MSPFDKALMPYGVANPSATRRIVSSSPSLSPSIALNTCPLSVANTSLPSLVQEKPAGMMSSANGNFVPIKPGAIATSAALTGTIGGASARYASTGSVVKNSQRPNLTFRKPAGSGGYGAV